MKNLEDYLYYQDDWATIYCGDCLEIMPQIEELDLILTDPPYGVNLPYGKYYDDSSENYWDWFQEVLEIMRNTAKGVIFTHRQESIKLIHGWNHMCIWNKTMAFGHAINGWIPRWEPIFIFGIQPNFQANPKRKPARYDVFNFYTEPNKTGHPAPKPLKLWKALIETFAGNIILDPFLGSGTTCVAAKDLNRKSVGIEINPDYCEIAVKRLRQEVFDFS